MKNILVSLIMGVLGGVVGAFFYFSVEKEKTDQTNNLTHTFTSASYADSPEPRQVASQSDREFRPSELPSDFVKASRKSTPSVVYIKTVTEGRYARTWFELFFEGGATRQTVSSGSGVIYTQDGYIITNNHVIDESDFIKVIHEKVEYDATVIGTDPSTDIAVLKVEGKDLPAVEIGNSSEVSVGEWVLAVGNPFNLNSTVTAGIVSAKGRDINILKSQFPIESFIQTDAAINPGNSGGALVDSEGRLIGINTAILSRTGSYAGYGFAVPVDIVRKVVDDIIKYGEVQKAFIGAEVIDLDPKIADRLDLENLNGVAVSYLTSEGSAEKAGLEKGDVIISVNGNSVNSRSEFEEQLSFYSPGDEITVTYKRGNKTQKTALVLENREGTTEILKKEIYSSKALGADLEVVSKIEKDMLGIDNGVRIVRVKDGFIDRLQIEEGFIVTHINKIPIDSPEKLTNILERIRGRVVIEGINKRGERDYYSYYF